MLKEDVSSVAWKDDYVFGVYWKKNAQKGNHFIYKIGWERPIIFANRKALDSVFSELEMPDGLEPVSALKYYTYFELIGDSEYRRNWYDSVLEYLN